METHEESDNILAQQMVYVVKETGKDVSVISDDTDVFALLLYHYVRQGLTQTVIMESPVQDRVSVDIKATALEHSAIIPDILVAHALSGCACPDVLQQLASLGLEKVRLLRFCDLGVYL